jgi:hypothetical protein
MIAGKESQFIRRGSVIPPVETAVEKQPSITVVVAKIALAKNKENTCRTAETRRMWHGIDRSGRGWNEQVNTPQNHEHRYEDIK